MAGNAGMRVCPVEMLWLGGGACPDPENLCIIAQAIADMKKKGIYHNSCLRRAEIMSEDLV